MAWPSVVTAAWTSAAVVAAAMAAAAVFRAADVAREERVGGELAGEAGEVGRRLALVHGAGRVLDQVGQRGAQVVEPVGEVGVAELAGGERGIGDRVGAGDDDAAPGSCSGLGQRRGRTARRSR